MDITDTLIFEKGSPIETAKKALILLHGRGGSAADISSLADYFCDDSFYIAVPEAVNHSWYPHTFLADEKLNQPWIDNSINIMKTIVEKINKKIATNNIYIMGFSQGACLSLEFSSRYATQYGGIVAFTGGLIGKTINTVKYNGNFLGTKVFIGNSDQDPYIPLSRSKESEEIMTDLGAKVFLKVYPGKPHTVTQEEIDWVKRNIF